MAARLVIEGGVPLRGEVRVSAAKNAALPLLAASLLSAEPVVLENVPRLADITTIRALLEGLGTEIEDRDGSTVVRTPALRSVEAPYELVSTMRASVLVLGPLLARAGRARVSMPGGCAIGARPDRSPPQGARAPRRRGHARPGLRGGPGRAAQGGADRLRPRDGDRHREPDDGRCPRGGHHHPRERGAGARDPGPGPSAHGDGREDPRRRHRAHRDRRRAGARRRAPPDHPGPRGSRHLPGGRGHHRRGRHRPGRGAGAPERRARQARGNGRRRWRSAPIASGSVRKTGPGRPTS